jgi:hypothetical protein
MSLLDKKSSVKLNSGQLVQGVAVVDSDGNQVTSFGGSGGGSTTVGVVTVTVGVVTVSNTVSNPVPVISGLNIPNHNRVSLAYSGSNLVGVAYSFNNVGVATLTLSYDGSNNLISIVRS